MGQALTLKIKGLYTLPSELSEVPEGSLSLARNIYIDAESIAEPRRGIDKPAYGMAINTDRAKRLFEFKESRLLHYNGTTLAKDTGSAITDFSGTYEPPDSMTPIRSVNANRNMYFTTEKGIYALDALSSTPYIAGAPRGLYLEANTTGSSGFLEDDGTNGNAVAYRQVWARKDANDNIVFGAPSQRAVLILDLGMAGSRDVSILIDIPQGITDEWFFQLYRSPATGSMDIEPSDEMQLVYEAYVTSAQVTAGTVFFTDSTPDDLAGATLYTSPSQETITKENNEPPFAKDIAEFKQHLFFANTKNKQRLFITLLAAEGGAISPSTALKEGDVITINGVDYLGASASTFADDEFQVYNAGTPAQNIRDTAIALCQVINRSTNNTGDNAIYAYYVSGVNETPGKILLESRSVGGAQFAVTFTPVVSGANPWMPELPTSGTGVSTKNDEYKNAVYFSKPGQPEAVPLAQVFFVGSADDEIVRIIPLRDSLFILKRKGGIYRLTGEDASSFRVDLFDSTASIRAPESAVVLSNAIYFLSDQGVVQCTETGVTTISRAIEDQIKTLFSYGLTNIAAYSYGIGYETDRKYILAVPSSSAVTKANHYFVYNTFTRAWTTWDGFSTNHGIVFSGDDKLYFCDADSAFLLNERKTQSNFDYADYGVALTITDVSGDGMTLTLTESDQITVGDAIYQSDSVFSIVSGVDTVAGTVTLAYFGDLAAGAATVYKAIDTQIRWVPQTAGNAGLLKQFYEIALLFKLAFTLNAAVEFFSEASGGIEEVPIEGATGGLWGFFNWGEIPWGGEIGRSPERTWVPLDKQRCTQLNIGFKHRIAFSAYQLNGLSVFFRLISEKFAR